MAPFFFDYNTHTTVVFPAAASTDPLPTHPLFEFFLD